MSSSHQHIIKSSLSSHELNTLKIRIESSPKTMEFAYKLFAHHNIPTKKGLNAIQVSLCDLDDYAISELLHHIEDEDRPIRFLCISIVIFGVIYIFYKLCV